MKEAIVISGKAGTGKTTIDPIVCEGCKVCAEFCPVDAIEFEDTVNGRWFISDAMFGPMLHANLSPAQQNSGKLVTLLTGLLKQ